MRTDTQGLLTAGIELAERTLAQARRELGWEVGELQQFVLHQVSRVHTERLAERLSLAHVGQSSVQGGLRSTKRAGSDVQTPTIEAGHRICETETLLSQQICRRNAAIVQLDLPGRLAAPAHLVLESAETEAVCAVFDDHGGDAFGAIIAGSAHDDVGVGIAAAGDEGLGSGEGIAFVRPRRAGLERRGVGPRAGFGEAVGQDGVHGQRARQEAGLEIVRAVAVDHGRAHVVNGEERRDGGAGHGQRLEDEGRVEARKAGAAAFLGDIEAAEAQPGQPGPEIPGNRALRFPVAGMGCYVFRAEFAGHVEDRRLFFAQCEIHG